MSTGIWLARHAQNMLGALGALSRNPVGTFLTVAVIGIALALPAALNVLVQPASPAAGNWSDVRDFRFHDTGEPAGARRVTGGRAAEAQWHRLGASRHG